MVVRLILGGLLLPRGSKMSKGGELAGYGDLKRRDTTIGRENEGSWGEGQKRVHRVTAG